MFNPWLFVPLLLAMVPIAILVSKPRTRLVNNTQPNLSPTSANLLPKRTEETLLTVFDTLLHETQVLQKACLKTIYENETKELWARAMVKAMYLDQEAALTEINVAQKQVDSHGDLAAATERLRKAFNWFSLYHTRLKRIYGLEEGEVPPLPTIV